MISDSCHPTSRRRKKNSLAAIHPSKAPKLYFHFRGKMSSNRKKNKQFSERKSESKRSLPLIDLI
jgi:hypothetical protein